MMPQISGKTFLVTGGAGFIGSNLCETLLKREARVVAYDNLSTGRYAFIRPLKKEKNFKFIKGDVLTRKKLIATIKEHNVQSVAHLAANANVRLGSEKTSLDLRQGIIATHSVLQAMKECDIREVVYTSSSVVYGRAMIKPTPEDYGPLKPISLYGASKLAAEGLITAFSNLFGIDYYIFRLGNVVGKNYSHGIVLDLVNKLKKNKKSVSILGTGRQRKSYVDVADCVNAMLFVYEKSKDHGNIFNVSTEDQISVKEIAEMVVERVAKGAKISYTGEDQGWPGDVPDFLLNCKKLKELGFRFENDNSKSAVKNTLEMLAA